MRPVLFSIGSIHIYGYGLMIALGILTAAFALEFRGRKHGYEKDLAFGIVLSGVLGGVLGGKLLYWITVFKDILQNPKILLDFGDGFVIYGSIIGGAIGIFIYLKWIKKTTVIDKWDLCVSAVAIGQAFGRIGCFLAGCCYGIELPEPTWYSVVFPESLAIGGVPRVPVQLLGSFLDFLLAGFLWWFAEKEKFGGEAVCAYFSIYAVGRFFIEYIRADERGNVGIFSTSQFIAILMFALAIAGFFIFRKINWKPVSEMKQEPGAQAV